MCFNAAAIDFIKFFFFYCNDDRALQLLYAKTISPETVKKKKSEIIFV